MSNLFFKFGRNLGYAAIPAIRKSKAAWKGLTGDAVDSLRAETEFGRALAAEMRLKAGVSRDPSEVALITEIERRLSACVRNKARKFKGEVLLDSTLTATALPGGFIFLSRGLLEFCQGSADELAFVTGHEMGHVIRGHALDRVLLRIGSQGLSSILSRGLLLPLLRDAGLAWLHGAHAHDAERDADEFGVRLASAAGYRAEAAFNFLERAQALRHPTDRRGEYLASHPSELERIANIKEILSATQRLGAGKNTGNA